MNFSRLPFGTFSFKIYGFFIALAFVLGAILFFRELKKRNFSTHFFLHNFWKWVLSGAVIGRLLIVIPNLIPLIERNGLLAFFAFWDGGCSFLGVCVGFLGGMIYHLRKKKIDYYRWIDALVIPFFQVLLLLDLGGFFTGQIYGTETSLPWGIQYETFSVDILNTIHPVTLYAFVGHFWILMWAKKYQKFWERLSGKLSIRAGLLFLMFEFVLQFFRGDQSVSIASVFRIEHLYIFLLVAFLFWRGHKNNTHTTSSL